jgi:hypothetical protein
MPFFISVCPVPTTAPKAFLKTSFDNMQTFPFQMVGAKGPMFFEIELPDQYQDFLCSLPPVLPEPPCTFTRSHFPDLKGKHKILSAPTDITTCYRVEGGRGGICRNVLNFILWPAHKT